MTNRTLGTSALPLALLVLCVSSLEAQSESVEQMLRVAAAHQELAHVIALGDASPEVRDFAARVRLAEFSAPRSGLRFWHARMPVAGSAPYTLGWDGTRVLRLGGFEAPELFAAASLLIRTPRLRHEPLELARELAVLADPNGGMEYAFVHEPSTGDAEAARRAWVGCYSEAVGDSFDSGDPTRTVVRLTLLTRDPDGAYGSWLPATYAFVFGTNHVLLAWSRRFRERFAPEAPCGQR